MVFPMYQKKIIKVLAHRLDDAKPYLEPKK